MDILGWLRDSANGVYVTLIAAGFTAMGAVIGGLAQKQRRDSQLRRLEVLGHLVSSSMQIGRVDRRLREMIVYEIQKEVDRRRKPTSRMIFHTSWLLNVLFLFLIAVAPYMFPESVILQNRFLALALGIILGAVMVSLLAMTLTALSRKYGRLTDWWAETFTVRFVVSLIRKYLKRPQVQGQTAKQLPLFPTQTPTRQLSRQSKLVHKPRRSTPAVASGRQWALARKASTSRQAARRLRSGQENQQVEDQQP